MLTVFPEGTVKFCNFNLEKKNKFKINKVKPTTQSNDVVRYWFIYKKPCLANISNPTLESDTEQMPPLYCQHRFVFIFINYKEDNIFFKLSQDVIKKVFVSVKLIITFSLSASNSCWDSQTTFIFCVPLFEQICPAPHHRSSEWLVPNISVSDS